MASPFAELYRKHKMRLLFGAIAFWCLIAVMIWVSEEVANRVLGAKFIDYVEQRQYLTRLVIWMLMTPLLMYVAFRINIKNTRVFWFIIIHLLLGTLFLVVEFTVEVSIMMPVAEKYYHRNVLLSEFALPFVHKYFAYILNYFLILGIANIYTYMFTLQKAQKELHQTEVVNTELKYQLAVAQMQTLKMQIHPHFLFNTHNSILALILKNENAKAAEMLGKLSDLLRKTIESQNEEFVPLRKELEIADLYLELQQVRFSDRLKYVRHISEESLDVHVPFFILQPLVENAIIHGVEKTPDASEVKLEAVKSGERLIITISNAAGKKPVEVSSGTGIGLSNVTDRIEKYYGKKATIALDFVNDLAIVAINLPANETA
jgi:LytS/YehU family sensor histidine kinase